MGVDPGRAVRPVALSNQPSADGIVAITRSGGRRDCWRRAAARADHRGH
jgi:hypothetical protein